jgi:hypothetical protein
LLASGAINVFPRFSTAAGLGREGFLAAATPSDGQKGYSLTGDDQTAVLCGGKPAF